jgi:hypothetical protein
LRRDGPEEVVAELRKLYAAAPTNAAALTGEA